MSPEQYLHNTELIQKGQTNNKSASGLHHRLNIGTTRFTRRKDKFSGQSVLSSHRSHEGRSGAAFSKTNCDIMNGLQALNPSSRSFLGDDVMLLAKAYGSNADDLKHEIHQCKRVLERLKN